MDIFEKLMLFEIYIKRGFQIHRNIFYQSIIVNVTNIYNCELELPFFIILTRDSIPSPGYLTPYQCK